MLLIGETVDGVHNGAILTPVRHVHELAEVLDVAEHSELTTKIESNDLREGIKRINQRLLQRTHPPG